MKNHPILSFLKGFILSSLLIGLFVLSFLLVTFDLAGGETIQEIEGQKIFLLFGTTIIAVVMSRFFFKSGKKHIAIGVIIPLLLGFAYFINDFQPSVAFEKVAWQEAEWKPLGMAIGLQKEEKLIGLNRQQVKGMLGTGAHESGGADRGSIVYFVEDEWTLTIYFDKGRVVNSELLRPRMMS